MAPSLQSILEKNMIDDYDSAFLLVDFDVLDNKLDDLSSSFPSNIIHAVAIKTNPILSVLEHIIRSGYLLEAASYEELILADKAGASGKKMIFDSPVKRHWEIAECEKRWPGMIINANTISELERFSKNSQLRIGLRINPLIQPIVHERYNVSSPHSKFGVPINSRKKIVKACLAYPVTGLHMHTGSGMLEPLHNINSVKILLDLAIEINSCLESIGTTRRIDFLDIGGGAAAEVDKIKMASYGHAISQLPEIENFEVYTEYGQWVHNPTSAAYSQIECLDNIGKPRPQAYIHLGADYFMRDAYTGPRNFTFTTYNKKGNLIESCPKINFDIVGPLCFSGDVLSKNTTLPEDIEEGDWIKISDTGANTYGLWSRHCSRDIPKIIGFSKEKGLFLIKNRTPVSM